MPPVLFQFDFFYYKFLGQGSHDAFKVVHSALFSVGINHAGTFCQKEFPAFCNLILRLIRSSPSLYFKLASFRARIFSNFTNSLIPQLSLSVQIVTDGAGNQDWSLKSGSGGRLVTLTINKKDHKISDQSLNSLPLDLGYKHHLHWSYSLPSFAATFDNEEHKSSIWFEKLILNISHIFQS